MFKFPCIRKRRTRIEKEKVFNSENGSKSGINSFNELNIFTVDKHGKNLFSQCFKGSEDCNHTYIKDSELEDFGEHTNAIRSDSFYMLDGKSTGIEVCQMHEESHQTDSHSESLSEKLFHLAKYGWYWGPLTQSEANAKLREEADGAFLVRDSSCEQYVLTLSFRSDGQTFHTHIEHVGGMFSLQTGMDYCTVEDLIKHSMGHILLANKRNSADNNNLFMPVKLTQPISRFTQVRPLQYLCRFVIRQYIRADIIPKLPVPQPIRKYIEESQF